jgi:hypothetical protein
MPLRVFIDAIVDGNTEDIDNFEDIYIEFCESIGGKQLEQSMDQNKEIVTLRSRVIVTAKTIEMLLMTRSKDMFDLLMSFEYPTQALEFSDENIEKLIMQIEPHLKLESVDLQVLQNALPKTKGSYTRDYFYSMLVEISTAFKMSVTDDISLRMYCAYVVKYKQYAEQLNKQNI